MKKSYPALFAIALICAMPLVGCGTVPRSTTIPNVTISAEAPLECDEPGEVIIARRDLKPHCRQPKVIVVRDSRASYDPFYRSAVPLYRSPRL